MWRFWPAGCANLTFASAVTRARALATLSLNFAQPMRLAGLMAGVVFGVQVFARGLDAGVAQVLADHQQWHAGFQLVRGRVVWRSQWVEAAAGARPAGSRSAARRNTCLTIR